MPRRPALADDLDWLPPSLPSPLAEFDDDADQDDVDEVMRAAGIETSWLDD